MTANFDFLFEYLKNEKIYFDQSEFIFQLESHPDYPSLLSISDTLNFFNIQSGVIKVDISEIELLPDSFITVLKVEDSSEINKTFFSLIVKKGNSYYSSYEKKTKIIEESKLASLWSGIVLLIESSDSDIGTQKRKSSSLWLKTAVGLCMLSIFLFYFSPNWQRGLFIIFPIIGLTFSLSILKSLFGYDSDLLNSICNITSSKSCASVFQSAKWRIFKVISFSDLSIIFFCTQFLGFLFFLGRSDIETYFNIQKMIVLLATPILLTSLYYQKFVEKKWCPICLIIIATILLELIYLFGIFGITTDFPAYTVILFGSIFIVVTILWSLVKKNLFELKELKEFQIKGNRFMRNYEIFRNNLYASQHIDHIPSQNEETIFLGNSKANLKIIVVTSPFCGFCADTNEVIEKILDRYSDKVCFHIYFNFNIEINDTRLRKIQLQLISVYFNQGQKAFRNSLTDWFKNKDENKLSLAESSVINNRDFNLVLENQSRWCQDNNINFTPLIVINGYFLPKQYDKKDLIYFINDLYEEI